jgi:cephalosporin-C deacetylase-like acetyl esterase
LITRQAAAVRRLPFFRADVFQFVFKGLERGTMMARVGIRGVLRLLSFLPVAGLFVAGSLAQKPTSTPAGSHPKAKSTAKKAASFHEDWNSIGLEKSVLTPEEPVFGEKSDIAGNNFVRELYQLTWRPGDPIDVYVVRPRGVERPPVVIYLYSFPQDTDRFKNDHWCGMTTSGGYAAVGFVSALTGHRSEHRPPKEWFVSELQESLATSTHDVQMVLNYLATRGDLDMDRVGMFGQGSGGAIAILAAAADPRIKALDVLTPWGDWPTWLAKSKFVPDDQRAKYVAPDFLARVAALDPLQWLPKVKARSIRIQNVRQDGGVPDSVEEKLEAAAPDITEIDQFGDSRALVPAAAGGRLLDWMKEQLKPDAKATVAAAKSERIHFYAAKGDTTIH